jgi:hypothetical protein
VSDRPFGVEAALAAGAPLATVISDTETTSRGDTLIHVSRVALGADHVGRPTYDSAIRLTPAERDRLIDELVLLRTADAERAWPAPQARKGGPCDGPAT